MYYSDIFKAAARKYLKRIPTGDPKRPWRYIYKVSDKKGRAGKEELSTEERFDAFLSEYESLSDENPIGLRDDRYWYMGEVEGKHCVVMTNVSVWDGNMMFNSIQTAPRDVCEKKGFASKVMDQIVSLADKHQIPLTLEVMPFASEAMSENELSAWYKRAGFKEDKIHGDEGLMVREPKR